VAEETTEENHQFEQVLNRLDALMKRSHVTASAEEPEQHAPVDEASADVPVLTEIYHGAALLPVAVEAQEAPPLLTEWIAAPQAEAVSAVVDEAMDAPAAPQVSVEQQVEAVVEALMPEIREMVARVVQEALVSAQQNLSSRIAQEAEQMLRQRLAQEFIPK